jgi:hypothetical protein
MAETRQIGNMTIHFLGENALSSQQLHQIRAPARQSDQRLTPNSGALPDAISVEAAPLD